MSAVQLFEVSHPDKSSIAKYGALVGIDDQKEALVTVLSSLLAPKALEAWLAKHHRGGLQFVSSTQTSAPLVILSGEVGCGKTALATSVASIVAKDIDTKITVLETPSDIRGSGLVGELSSRIVAAFEQARQKASKTPTILIIDESDDLATSRSQNQAHHEDRAGVNVLLKQLDLVGRERLPIAVIMITNRESTLDAAVLRRAALSLTFARPNAAARSSLFSWMLSGTNPLSKDIDELVRLTESAIPYTFSDLTDRIGKLSLRTAWKNDVPFSAAVIKRVIPQVTPSPFL